mgnify:CR=1 FL=1
MFDILAFDIGSNKVCTVNGKNGTCMFTSKCKERKGYVLGTCRHNFIFGACCADEADEATEPDKAIDAYGRGADASRMCS